MTRAELLNLVANLDSERINRLKLGGYGADAKIIEFLTVCLLDVAQQLVLHDRAIAQLKRAPKKKKK